MPLSPESKTDLVNALHMYLPECSREDVIYIRDAFEARLSELKDKAREDLAAKLKAKRAEVDSEVRAEAEAEGLDFDDLAGKGRKRTLLPAIYRNPSNQQEEWSGRGKKPGWFVTHLANGYTPEAMRILGTQ